MSKWVDIILDAFDSEPHQGLTMIDGAYREGYILGYGEDWIDWGEGGPLADDKIFRYKKSEIKSIWYTTGNRYKEHKIE